MITPQIRTATSDFITGSCKSAIAKLEPTVIMNSDKLLKITSMTLAFISINHLDFSQN